MTRYIDASALSNDMAKVINQLVDKGVPCTGLKLLKQIIEDEPAADVEPVRHAHWVMLEDGHGVCSNCIMCSVDLLGGADHNYCPNCGAKMDEVE